MNARLCRYDVNDLQDAFRHLTNTAQSVKDAQFQEENSVMVRSDPSPRKENYFCYGRKYCALSKTSDIELNAE